jgi:hypothetical protein
MGSEPRQGNPHCMQHEVKKRGRGHGGQWRRRGRVQDGRRARVQHWLASGSSLRNQHFSVRGRHCLRCWVGAGKRHDPTVTRIRAPRARARTRDTTGALKRSAARALARAAQRGAAVGVGGGGGEHLPRSARVLAL